MENLLKTEGVPDIFILVHYFGFPNQIDKAEDFCKRHNIALVEDAAHMIFAPSFYMPKNNFTIYSLRKLLPVPEGGLLVTPKKEERHNTIEGIFDDNIFFCTKWIMRSLLKILIVNLRIPAYRIKTYVKDVRGKNIIRYKCGNSQRRCASYSLKLFSTINKDIHSLIEKRRYNYLQLSRLLKGIPGIDFLYPYLLPEVCPYVFPILTSKYQGIIINRLNRQYGIPATNWPDLPPEVIGSKDGHNDAIWLQKHIILLPIHQSLNEKHMVYISNSFKKSLYG
jgi:dTDP-4-amino-4,6-dideoxygalactose transaminase